LVESEHGRGGLVLLELQVTVAFGAEVLRGRAPEEAAVVGAQPRRLASMLFRHFSPKFNLSHNLYKSKKLKEKKKS
jgi:hypothetical protein